MERTMADQLDTLDGQDAGQDAGGNEQEAPNVDELMKEIKSLRRENAKWRTQLRSVEEQQQAKQRSEMTELEKLQAELKAEREARTRAEQERRQTDIRSQVLRTASKLDYADPEDGWRMLDLDALDVDENGSVIGLEDALKDLLKVKDYLKKKTTPAGFNPTNPAGGAPKQSDEAILAEIYGRRGAANIWGGQGGGVVWNTNATE